MSAHANVTDATDDALDVLARRLYRSAVDAGHSAPTVDDIRPELLRTFGQRIVWDQTHDLILACALAGAADEYASRIGARVLSDLRAAVTRPSIARTRPASVGTSAGASLHTALMSVEPATGRSLAAGGARALTAFLATKPAAHRWPIFPANTATTTIPRDDVRAETPHV